MTNKEIYMKTLGFSLRRVFWDVISLVLLLGCGTLGYMIGDKKNNAPLGLLIGALVGLILMVVITLFLSYKLKAAQIAMMTRGVSEGELPDNVIAEGKKVVKERFATILAFFAITNAIKAIFNQLGRGATKLGQSIGGDTGGAVGSAVSSVMQTIVNYLCDCCLGWVFFRSNVKPAKAACEGAVVYFKHGKTFFKNMGRIFGMGLVSLLAIGGVFGGLFYAIFGQQAFWGTLSVKVAEHVTETGWLADLIRNPQTLPIVAAVIIGLIMWSILHSVFVKPFVLTGVLRNFIESGRNDIPTEDSFSMLDSKSKRFRKLRDQM